MPNPEDMFPRLAKAKYFTKVALTHGYWQIKLHPDCEKSGKSLGGEGYHDIDIFHRHIAHMVNWFTEIWGMCNKALRLLSLNLLAYSPWF